MIDMLIFSFFEYFYIFFVKLYLSLFLGFGGEELDKEKQEMFVVYFVNLLLKSIGVILIDVDDFIFKFVYYEI